MLPGDVPWDPESDSIDQVALEGFDAVVHLAGESIASGRWTEKKKTRIRESRARGTRLLAEALAGLDNPPRVLVSASAVGFYGHRGGEILTEKSERGTGFLADVCRDWEAAADRAASCGIRVVKMRLGMVLSPDGGALAKLLPVFRMGAGGVIGDGSQYMSWIALDDVVLAIAHFLGSGRIEGPVNTVSPSPVTNREFTKTLGRVLRRPTLFRVPGFAARALFGGEMADELLLASARAHPEKLLADGHSFAYPELESALRHLLA
jgi:uncharacterized protein (TIGR01777 family)